MNASLPSKELKPSFLCLQLTFASSRLKIHTDLNCLSPNQSVGYTSSIEGNGLTDRETQCNQSRCLDDANRSWRRESMKIIMKTTGKKRGREEEEKAAVSPEDEGRCAFEARQERR